MYVDLHAHGCGDAGPQAALQRAVAGALRKIPATRPVSVWEARDLDGVVSGALGPAIAATGRAMRSVDPTGPRLGRRQRGRPPPAWVPESAVGSTLLLAGPFVVSSTHLPAGNLVQAFWNELGAREPESESEYLAAFFTGLVVVLDARTLLVTGAGDRPRPVACNRIVAATLPRTGESAAILDAYLAEQLGYPLETRPRRSGSVRVLHDDAGLWPRPAPPRARLASRVLGLRGVTPR